MVGKGHKNHPSSFCSHATLKYSTQCINNCWEMHIDIVFSIDCAAALAPKPIPHPRTRCGSFTSGHQHFRANTVLWALVQATDWCELAPANAVWSIIQGPPERDHHFSSQTTGNVGARVQMLWWVSDPLLRWPWIIDHTAFAGASSTISLLY